MDRLEVPHRSRSRGVRVHIYRRHRVSSRPPAPVPRRRTLDRSPLNIHSDRARARAHRVLDLARVPPSPATRALRHRSRLRSRGVDALARARAPRNIFSVRFARSVGGPRWSCGRCAPRRVGAGARSKVTDFRRVGPSARATRASVASAMRTMVRVKRKRDRASALSLVLEIESSARGSGRNGLGDGTGTNGNDDEDDARAAMRGRASALASAAFQAWKTPQSVHASWVFQTFELTRSVWDLERGHLTNYSLSSSSPLSLSSFLHLPSSFCCRPQGQE